jgi:hypothetical protein
MGKFFFDRQKNESYVKDAIDEYFIFIKHFLNRAKTDTSNSYNINSLLVSSLEVFTKINYNSDFLSKNFISDVEEHLKYIEHIFIEEGIVLINNQFKEKLADIILNIDMTNPINIDSDGNYSPKKSNIKSIRLFP